MNYLQFRTVICFFFMSAISFSVGKVCKYTSSKSGKGTEYVVTWCGPKPKPNLEIWISQAGNKANYKTAWEKCTELGKGWELISLNNDMLVKALEEIIRNNETDWDNMKSDKDWNRNSLFWVAAELDKEGLRFNWIKDGRKVEGIRYQNMVLLLKTEGPNSLAVAFDPSWQSLIINAATPNHELKFICSKTKVEEEHSFEAYVSFQHGVHHGNLWVSNFEEVANITKAWQRCNKMYTLHSTDFQRVAHDLLDILNDTIYNNVEQILKNDTESLTPSDMRFWVGALHENNEYKWWKDNSPVNKNWFSNEKSCQFSKAGGAGLTVILENGKLRLCETDPKRKLRYMCMEQTDWEPKDKLCIFGSCIDAHDK